MLVTRHLRRKLMTFSVSTVGFFLSSFSAVLALGFTGPVVSVLDGDTIEVLHNTRPERVRLSGIDCPEKGQATARRSITRALNGISCRHRQWQEARMSKIFPTTASMCHLELDERVF